jgi:hypothetical protein
VRFVAASSGESDEAEAQLLILLLPLSYTAADRQWLKEALRNPLCDWNHGTEGFCSIVMIGKMENSTIRSGAPQR